MLFKIINWLRRSPEVLPPVKYLGGSNLKPIARSAFKAPTLNTLVGLLWSAQNAEKPAKSTIGFLKKRRRVSKWLKRQQ